MKWLALVALITSASCTCVRTDGLVFECGPDGGCPAGLVCERELELCLPADGGGGDDGGMDAGADGGDGGADAGRDGGVDGGPDAGRDGGADGGLDGGRDGGLDGGPDAGRDAGFDAGRPPSGESCLEPFPVVFDGGTQRFTGNLDNAKDDVAGTCASSDSTDYVYAFDGGGLLTVNLVNMGSQAFSQVGVETACAGGTLNFCDLNTSASVTPIGGTTLLPNGHWFVVVDSYAGRKGPFTLDLALSPAVVGEYCDSPRLVTAGDAGFIGLVSLAGTVDARQRPPSCSKADAGHDVVTQLIVPRTGALTVSSSAVFPHALAVTQGADCVAASEVPSGCVARDAGQATVVVPVAPAGTYWVWVSSTQAAEQGTITLEIDLQ